eukprot:scaffold221018_cov48-Prasinocladus_malaysianus.AAC.2
MHSICLTHCFYCFLRVTNYGARAGANAARLRSLGLPKIPPGGMVFVQGAWPEVIRCISRYDLLVQQHSGAPGDNILFAPGSKDPAPVREKSKTGIFSRRSDTPATVKYC